MASKKKAKAKANKPKKAKASKVNGARVSFKDVQLAYALDGLDGVIKALGERKAAKNIINKAIAGFKAQGHDTSKLESYVEKTYPATIRGRAMPEAGEDRDYKAQQLGKGGAFLRLPLNPLGVEKGASVKVSFKDDRITVVRA